MKTWVLASAVVLFVVWIAGCGSQPSSDKPDPAKIEQELKVLKDHRAKEWSGK